MDGDGSHQEYPFAVYITFNKERPCETEERGLLEELLKSAGPHRRTRTSCGSILSFLYESDADLVLTASLGQSFASSLQVVKFSTRDLPKKQALLLRDVPAAIPLQEIKVCLEKQGMTSEKIERQRQNVKVEISDGVVYERLLREGLDFFGVGRFSAVPERWRRSPADLQQDPVIQCYRCQHFWHIAAQCSRPARCVRCGGPHSVESCTRPRDEPFCCHCGGPHHAAYRHCPYRLQSDRVMEPEGSFPSSMAMAANTQMSSGFQLYPFQSVPAAPASR